MAHRHRVLHRKPRMSGPASDCIVYDMNTGKVKGSFEPRKPMRHWSVEVAPPLSSGIRRFEQEKLYVKFSDL